MIGQSTEERDEGLCLNDLVHRMVGSDIDSLADNKGLLMSSMGMVQSRSSVRPVEDRLIASEHASVIDKSASKTTTDWAENRGP